MAQTVLTLISELQPSRAAAARRLIEDLRIAVFGPDRPQGTDLPIIAAVPGLHFASIMVFEDERFDPMVTVELNFDGPAGPFLPKLETPLLAPILRAILRCCKRPEDARGAMYDAVTAAQARLPMAPYLETLIVRPAVFHQGNRGLDRERIVREAALYDSVQTALEQPDCRDAADATALHKALRAQVRTANPWIDRATLPRIPAAEQLLDMGRFWALVAAVLVGLLVPGLLLGLALPPPIEWLLALAALAAVVAAAIDIGRKWRPDKQKPKPPRAPQLPPAASSTIGPWIMVAGVMALLVLVLCVLVPGLPAAVAGAVLLVAGAVLWLRRLEKTDRVQEAPQIDPVELRKIMQLEDRVSQNHMGSVVHVKPGILRAILIRLGLHGLGLLLRWRATDGYLADMRTIHFAHWALIDNGSRLLFFSNFDSSWESYLDDFIEKAHPGLTLAWSNGRGFPRTRFLVEDGATNGPLFKTWARHSMAESLFWVSAYPALSVNQIERNCEIAMGLCRTSLKGRAAARWAALL